MQIWHGRDIKGRQKSHHGGMSHRQTVNVLEGMKMGGWWDGRWGGRALHSDSRGSKCVELGVKRSTV